MKIPKKIKVVDCNYTVEEHKLLYETNGMSIADMCKILIKESLSEDKKKQTFIHELIHAIENTNNAIDDLSEIQVELIATGLMSFIRDNKNTVLWLLEK